MKQPLMLTEDLLNVIRRQFGNTTSCAVDACSFVPFETLDQDDLLRWLWEHIPGLDDALARVLELIFSNNLTSGDEDKDEKILNPWLYGVNINGVPNINILREAAREMFIFGRSGVRWLSEEDGVIKVDSRYYAVLTQENTDYYGFEEIIAYLVSTDKTLVHNMTTTEVEIDRKTFEKKGILYDPEKKLLILSKEEFLNLTRRTSPEGESIFSKDKLRVKLLKTVYELLIHDLEYDGPGRIILPVDTDGLSNYQGYELENETAPAQKTKTQLIKAEAASIAQDIKNSRHDNVIPLSQAFDAKNIVHLPRITKATDLLAWLANEDLICSALLNINPVLIGKGKISGNISQEKIIDQEMLNQIIPLREQIHVQLSNFIAPKLGLEKIYFDKYELKQKQTEIDDLVKLTTAAANLSRAGFTEEARAIAQNVEERASQEELHLSVGQKLMQTVKGWFKK